MNTESHTAVPTDKKEFVPYSVDAQTVATAVLLLESPEHDVICNALHAITKFVKQDETHREIVYNLNALKHVLRHIDHKELNIKRLALKALAQLSQLPHVRALVLEDESNLRKVATQLAKMEDIFVQEFSSLVLAELTLVHAGCEQLVAANILNSLFNRMKNSPDPDVQKNCLQTLSNLLADKECASEVTKNHQFDWTSILVLMQSKYVAIQIAALTTVRQLISRYDDAVVQRTFKASTGITDVCDILEVFELQDIHMYAIEVLRAYIDTEENKQHLHSSGCVLRLVSSFDTTFPDLRPPYLSLFAKMSFTVTGRNALFDTGADLVFCHQLLTMDPELLADAALGVSNMSKQLPSAIRMAETNIIGPLCCLLADEEVVWFNIRMNGLRAMAELCRKIPKAVTSLVESKTFDSLVNINRNYRNSPIEAQRLAVQCYLNLLHFFHLSQKVMLTEEFVDELLSILIRPDLQLKIMTINVFIGMMSEEVAQYLFTKCKGEVVVNANLKIEHKDLRTALCKLIMSSVTDDGADIYLELGTIHYMVENSHARYAVDAWEPALEQIFRHHASAKFGYTGRLDTNDFTAEGFYVLKRLGEYFPTMAELEQSPPPHLVPVIVVVFQPPFTDFFSSGDIRTPHRRSRTSLRASTSRKVSTSSRLRFLEQPDDANLRDYLTQLKLWFGDPAKSLHYFEIEDSIFEVRYRDKCQEVTSSLKERAKLLGEYVCEQMNGTAQETDCSMPSVNLHLSDLMVSLKSRIIGLGWIRVGGTLERALLYKVLADRIGLPCALYRASSAHAWCEVAVPEMAPEDHGKDIQFPAGLLRANYVVDLMFQPGRLLPLDCVEARRICGPKGAPLYVSRRPPQVCACNPGAGKKENRY